MLASDLKKAKELRKAVASFGMRPKVKFGKKKAPLRPSPFKFDYQSLKPKDVIVTKEVSRPTHEELLPIITPIVKQLIEEKEPIKSIPFELTPEIVKQIVVLMHQLPETDRLDVSGIRNYQSFIYKGTKYGAEEMMHGGGSSTSSGGTVYYTPSGTVNGSNTTFTPTSTPTSVNADGITYFSGAGYTFTAGNIIMDIPPSSYIRYTL